MKMKAAKTLLLLSCLIVLSYALVKQLPSLFLFMFGFGYDMVIHLLLFAYEQIAAPQICPADNGAKCSDLDGWEGEFFPGIPKIKYEVN